MFRLATYFYTLRRTWKRGKRKMLIWLNESQEKLNINHEVFESSNCGWNKNGLEKISTTSNRGVRFFFTEEYAFLQWQWNRVPLKQKRWCMFYSSFFKLSFVFCSLFIVISRFNYCYLFFIFRSLSLSIAWARMTSCSCLLEKNLRKQFFLIPIP